MAKRSRRRPGQRPSAARPAGRPKAPPPLSRPAGGLSAAEEARAAELENQILAQEREAEASLARQRERRRGTAESAGYAPGRTREGSLLAARAAEEYQYVARDVRRIVRVGGSLVGILAVLFVLIDVVKIVKL